VWFNSVLRADGERITVGADTNIQDLALCHVDPGRPLVIGERVTIGHGAILRGCTIEDDVIVGAGATVMHGSTIGRGSTIAVGAVVLEHMHAPPFSLITGSPANIKPAYADQDTCLARAAKQAHQYCARASAYRRSLREMLDQPEGTECRQWGQAAWEEAAVRLGYPRLHVEGADERVGTGAEGFFVKHDRLRETSILPQPGPTSTENSEQVPQVRAPQRPTVTIGGGVASLVVATTVGAVASVVVTALRKRRSL